MAHIIDICIDFNVIVRYLSSKQVVLVVIVTNKVELKSQLYKSTMTKVALVEISEEQDWHPADIKAALEKKGWSLGKLARAHGYNRKSPSLALKQPWPRMEQIIAEAIGVEPRELWPSRYSMDGKPNRRVGRPSACHVDTFDSTEKVKLQREKSQ